MKVKAKADLLAPLARNLVDVTVARHRLLARKCQVSVNQRPSPTYFLVLESGSIRYGFPGLGSQPIFASKGRKQADDLGRCRLACNTHDLCTNCLLC